MSDLPAPSAASFGRRLAARLWFARGALLWEVIWPAMWPALCTLGVFGVMALFDILPALPSALHAAALALFGLVFATALVWGWRQISVGAPSDRVAARRRIEQASGLRHRPLAVLEDRPSVPLDADAATLWAAHQGRARAALRRLRVGWPAAGLARHDPLGVRVVLTILLLLGAIDAGADWHDRLTRALSPSLHTGKASAATSFDAWLTPPDYTGLPPRFLRAGESAMMKVPSGSVLLVQVHGGGKPQLAIDDATHDFVAVDPHNFRLQATLKAGRLLTLSEGRDVLGRWPIEIVPDLPPTIAFARTPQGTPRAALRLDYRAADDYGVESVKAVIHRQGGNAKEAIELELPLPGLHLKQAEASSYHDLSPHPWAGLPVEIRLVATDALGQTGESEPVRVTLPERVFRNPIARAIIDQRKELAKDPGAAEAVSEILGDLDSRPKLFRDDAVVYLALRLAQDELRQKPGMVSIAAVEKLLWDTALRIEDGNMSLAEREMRQLQQQLQDALAKGAPDAEIDRLMSQLRQALDRYMQALAQQLQQHPDEALPPIDPSKVVSSQDLQRMIDRARELAQSGDREAARQLLSQLQNMLENLHAARPGEMRQRSATRAQQTMRGLQQLMQQQQQLLDRSFRAERRSSGQPNGDSELSQQQGGQGASPENGDAVPGDEMGDAAGQQEGLRRQLGDMMRQLGEGMGDIPEPFGRAERAMHDAAGALKNGRPGQAIAPQTEALDQLQQAARDVARKMQQQLGGWGGPNQPGAAGNDREGPEGSEHDPLGRPLSSDGTYDQSDVRIPDDNIMQKSREILDELRRRAAERSRPQIELDYIDRLLKRF